MSEPITKDLKPDEFELTFDCPVEGCNVQTTFAWSNDAKKYPGEIRKEAKKRIAKAHQEGKHNVKN